MLRPGQRISALSFPLLKSRTGRAESMGVEFGGVLRLSDDVFSLSLPPRLTGYARRTALAMSKNDVQALKR